MLQIWFQNRRQMTRRKTQPLLPLEVMSIFHSSQESADNVTNASLPVDESRQQTTQLIDSSGKSNAPDSEQAVDDLNPMDPLDVRFNSPATAFVSVTSDSGAVDCKSLRKKSLMKARNSSISTVHARQGLRYENCPSDPFATQDLADVELTIACEDIGHSALSDNIPSFSRRGSSSIRLSMSLDGKAQVITDKELPSPLSDIGLKPRSRGTLQRSHSAIEPNDVSTAFQRSSVTGRSRDARTWEFYCDSDARNALTEQAEREKGGSAIGPIGLIRSRSNKAIAPNNNKRNANSSKHEPTKRQKPDGPLAVKPKLARAVSSVASFQSLGDNVHKQEAKRKDKATGGVQTALCDHADDSDKENWEPGTQTSINRRRRVPNSQLQRTVLEESLHHPSVSSSLALLMNRENITPHSKRSNTSEYPNGKNPKHPEIDDEVAEFMRERPAEKTEDMDCVQNLLSLKRGAWTKDNLN